MGKWDERMAIYDSRSENALQRGQQLLISLSYTLALAEATSQVPPGERERLNGSLSNKH